MVFAPQTGRLGPHRKNTVGNLDLRKNQKQKQKQAKKNTKKPGDYKRIRGFISAPTCCQNMATTTDCGCFVVLNGPVCAGKSTLAQLILREGAGFFQQRKAAEAACGGDEEDGLAPPVRLSNLLFFHVDFDSLAAAFCTNSKDNRVAKHDDDDHDGDDVLRAEDVLRLAKEVFPRQSLDPFSVSRAVEAAASRTCAGDSNSPENSGDPWDNNAWHAAREAAFAFCEAMVAGRPGDSAVPGRRARTTQEVVAFYQSLDSRTRSGIHLSTFPPLTAAMSEVQDDSTPIPSSTNAAAFVVVVLDDNMLLRSMRKK